MSPSWFICLPDTILSARNRPLGASVGTTRYVTKRDTGLAVHLCSAGHSSPWGPRLLAHGLICASNFGVPFEQEKPVGAPSSPTRTRVQAAAVPTRRRSVSSRKSICGGRCTAPASQRRFTYVATSRSSTGQPACGSDNGDEVPSRKSVRGTGGRYVMP
jgi:hypothetical protein